VQPSSPSTLRRVALDPLSAQKNALGKVPKGFGLIRHPTRKMNLPVGVISRPSGSYKANPIALAKVL